MLLDESDIERMLRQFQCCLEIARHEPAGIGYEKVLLYTNEGGSSYRAKRFESVPPSI